MIKHCQKAEIDEALARVDGLWEQGYSAVDIVTTIFRVVKGMEDLPEYTKLEFIRVRPGSAGFAHGLVLAVCLTRRKLGGHICVFLKASERSFSSER